MKKTKENSTGEQCGKTENQRKNNSKRAWQFLKDFATVKQGKAATIQDRSGNGLTDISNRNPRNQTVYQRCFERQQQEQ